MANENGRLIAFKITKNGAEITTTSNKLEEGENTFRQAKVSVERKPSTGLTIALRTLLTHALLKCELAGDKIKEKDVNSRKAVDMPAFKGYEIDSFSLAGDDEDEKLSIKMTKRLTSGDSFAIAVPAILICDENYPYTNQLAEDLDNLIKECWYFEEGKNYLIQGDLFKQKEEVSKDDEEQF